MLTACGGDPPDKEIQQADAAIAAAVNAGADDYAVEELKAARDALVNAREAVADRDYRLALNHALDGREHAQNAAAQAAAGRAAARDAAAKAISAGTSSVESAASKIKAAEAAHVSPRLLTAPRASVAAAEARLQEARAAWDRGDFPAATTAATAAVEDLAAVAEDLDSLVPVGRRRR
jgi:hypothetical protein